ncbi:glycosyltransferase family 4 protein (plasmid) [Tundrisphaera sp. TA3]|uniref:glycosyltransferase family 4 protein n=1 Tax=Tundrisphaera sp. TA3 TaxID=3435775 RepID=UPI003EBBB84B
MNEPNRRLRIAFVIHDYNRHLGQGRYVAELASRFRADHDVHVFANRFEEPDAAGITYHHVPAWRPNALATILSFAIPATAMARGPFDIVHAQGLCGLRHDVATAHFCRAGWDEALARLRGRPTWRQALAKLLVTPLERFALAARSTRRVIAVSGRIRDELERYYGRRDGVRVIYHGVDLDAFHPRNRERFRGVIRADLGVREGECLALYAGDLQKGAAAAIRATARVPGVRLVLVSGSDPAADRAVARAEGVADRVVFRPYSRQVERYFAAADVFLFPTLYDAYGMVISEAMAAGLPVVTSRAAGASELIEHGRDGWLTADPWDRDQVAEGLQALARDSDLRARMGEAARSTIERYTWDRAASETLSVYREISREARR